MALHYNLFTLETDRLIQENTKWQLYIVDRYYSMCSMSMWGVHKCLGCTAGLAVNPSDTYLSKRICPGASEWKEVEWKFIYVTMVLWLSGIICISCVDENVQRASMIQKTFTGYQQGHGHEVKTLLLVCRKGNEQGRTSSLGTWENEHSKYLIKILYQKAFKACV